MFEGDERGGPGTGPTADLRDRRVNDLERRVAATCGQLNVCHGQLVDLVVDALVNKLWEGPGFRSLSHWVALRTGLSPQQARDLVLVAERAAELPVTVAALRAGRLSIDQVVVVAQTVPAHNDAEACDLALACAVSQLRFALRRYPFDHPHPEPEAAPDTDRTEAADGDDEVETDAAGPGADGTADGESQPDDPAASPPPPDPRLADSVLSFFFDDAGRFQLRLDGAFDDGLHIDAALREARDALFRAGRKHVSWADALLEVCRRSIASNQITGIGTSRSDRYRLYLHLDTEGAWVHGRRVPQALVDQILCDGIIRPVWTTDGKPVNVGRATKVVSPELRRLVLHRDGHTCRTTGCGGSHNLEVHHVKWFERDHGRTDTNNLAAACGRCHHLIHQGTLHVAGNADDPKGLIFTDERGRNLIRHPIPIPPTELPDPAVPYEHPTGERLDTRWLWFTPAPRPPTREAAA